MNSTIEYFSLIESNAEKMGGIFTLSDLRILFHIDNPVLLHRRIALFEEKHVLTRFCRGFYTTRQFNLEALSARIYPDSCISFGNVLARETMIGSIPSKTVHAVRCGRNRLFQGAGETLVYYGIAPHLMVGFRSENGLRFALPEKAFLDVLYFYQKGRRFSFDPFSDINLTRINPETVESLLSNYRNPKFVAFVKGVLSNG
ncbi:MAG: hypothetical protein JW913_03880 [Chitinispirillaceae bacterium]|nr:hypothetical protein [Chitinispirillaceae bacterium]